jgi:dTDP-4-dehydrorhamnose reductase
VAGPASRPILLLGAGGQLGSALAPRLARLGSVVAATRADVDLERVADIRSFVARIRPAMVINAAAYTAVDEAEHDSARCARLNADAPTVLAEETARLAVPLMHFSTNYVFDGLQPHAYGEDDRASPLSVYGTTKLAGERGVAAGNARHLIVRTAAVYGGHGRNFMRRILELSREREELRVVDDQIVAPTAVSSLADAVVHAVREVLEPTRDAPPFGRFHLTASGSTSWYGFAEQILARDPCRREQRVRRVIPVTSGELAAPARRPANGLLDSAWFHRRFGIALPPWDEDLGLVLSPVRGAPDASRSG